MSEDIKQQLEENIKNKTAIIGVVGLGYVGLPLAIAIARAGYQVLGFDIQQKRVDQVNNCQSYIADVSNEDLTEVLSNNLLLATIEQNRLDDTDAICICVPTPLTRTKDPELSYVKHVSEEISKHLKSGQLIVLESTTYPGTTREIVLPILEHSGLNVGTDFFLAYSPERVDPGNRKYNIGNTPKVIGGIDKSSGELAQILYSQIAETVVPVSCPEAAEMTKIYENVFRSVNIALANEMAQLCHAMGVSVWEVIGAAATKPFGFMPFYPGPGVGGHCIPLDPYYLANKAREFDFHTRFIELAAEINEHMPAYVVAGIMEALNTKGKSLNGANILILGLAYKGDVEDLRESPSLKLLKLLTGKGANIRYNDPLIPKIQISHGTLNSVELTKETLSSADCVVIGTKHSSYDFNQVQAHSKLVFDTRGATIGLNGDNIFRLGE